MVTLKHIKDKKKRLRTIQETQDVYVPLAKLFGMFDEAKELDEWCLRGEDSEHEQIADKIVKYFEIIFSEGAVLQPSSVEKEIQDTISNGAVKVHHRIPDAYDIYRGRERFVDVRRSDMYLNIDAALSDISEGGTWREWSKRANDIAGILSSSGLYDLEEYDPVIFFKEAEEGYTDSLTINLRRRSDGLRLQVNIFPEEAYDREQVPLPDIYYQRESREMEEAGNWGIATVDYSRLPLPVIPEQETTRRHILAERKRAVLKDHYREVMGELERTGRIVSSQLMRRLGLRLPVGADRVIGVDDFGKKEPWRIKSGSTVMDFVYDIEPNGRWITAVSATVNGIPASFDQVLRTGDIVHIIFDPERTDHRNPLWIHCFRTNQEVAGRLRTRIKNNHARRSSGY